LLFAQLKIPQNQLETNSKPTRKSLMPRTLRPTAYPAEFEHLLVTAHAQGRYLLSLESERHAKALKSKLYVYFSALRHDDSRPDLIRKANALSLSSSGAVLCLSLTADSWDAQAIRDSLGLLKDTPAPPPEVPDTLQSQLQSRLAELRAQESADTARGKKKAQMP
jgi:hypothetical protein